MQEEFSSSVAPAEFQVLSSPNSVARMWKVTIMTDGSEGQWSSGPALVASTDVCVLISCMEKENSSEPSASISFFHLSIIPTAAKDLVSRLLVVDPKKSDTALQVLQHPWLEAAGKTSRANLQKEVPPSSEDHFRS